MLKRIICVLIAIQLMSGLVTFAAESETVAAKKDSYSKLVATGVIDEGKGSSADSISRAELARYVVRTVLKQDASAFSFDYEGFSDVEPSYENAASIYAAYRLGLIGGTSEDTYSPQENATLSQVVKVLVCLIGYGDIAEFRGGYPTGYVITANELELFDGVESKELNQAVSHDDFMTLLWNAVNVQMLEPKYLKASDGLFTSYGYREGESLIGCFYGIYRATGIVTADMYTSVYGETSLEGDYVEINEEAYRVGTTLAADLLGYDTEYFYHTEGNTRVLDFIEPYEDVNKTVTVRFDSIASVSADGYEFTYEASENKEKTIRLSKDTSLIYNGKQTPVTKEKLMPQKGDVCFIDNDGDGSYEVVRVNSYRTFVVAGISEFDGTVTDKITGDKLKLDPKSNDYVVEYYSGGKKTDSGKIYAGSVLSVAQSEGSAPNIKRVYISNRTKFCAPEEIGNDSVMLEGKHFKADKSVLEKAKLGYERNFYIDIFDYAVYSDLNSEAENRVVYGYLNGMKIMTMNRLQVRIFTENNRWVTLDVAEKIKYNGEKKSSKDFYGDYPTKADYRMLITYRVNEDAEVVEINTAKTFEPWSDEELAAIDNQIFRLSRTASNQQFRDSIGTLGNQFFMNGSTKIFTIPDQSKEDASEDDFAVISMSQIIGDTTLNKVYAYDCDKTLSPGAVVIFGQNFDRMVNQMSKCFYINSVTTALNTEGEEVYKLSGMYSRHEMSLYTVEKDKISAAGSLLPGDIIQFEINPDGFVSSVSCIASMSKDSGQKFMENGYYTRYTFVGGVVKTIDYETAKAVVDSGSEGILSLSSSYGIYIWDSAEKEFANGSLSDVSEGTFVFARCRYLIAEELAIFK